MSYPHSPPTTAPGRKVQMKPTNEAYIPSVSIFISNLAQLVTLILRLFSFLEYITNKYSVSCWRPCIVTFLRIRLFWDGLKVTKRPQSWLHGPLVPWDGHLLHFMSYSTSWLVVPRIFGGSQSNVSELSVLSTNVTSITAEGTPKTVKTLI